MHPRAVRAAMLVLLSHDSASNGLTRSHRFARFLALATPKAYQPGQSEQAQQPPVVAIVAISDDSGVRDSGRVPSIRCRWIFLCVQQRWRGDYAREHKSRYGI